MSVVNHTVELPSDVRHHLTMATALSWDAWDELTATDGWEETVILDAGDGVSLTQREAVVRGHHIVIFPPEQSRWMS